MIRILIILVFCFFTVPSFSYEEGAKEEIFLSTPEQVATLSTQSQFFVDGIISPLSGSPTLRQTDFVVKGAQELALSRTYISPHMPVQLAYEKDYREEWEKYHLYHYLIHNYKGWQFYPHLKLQCTPSEKQVLVTDPSGSTLCFSFTGPGMTNAKFEGETYGISNCAGETPSGANDLRNTRITYDDNGRQITVYGIDKGVRIYRLKGLNSRISYLYLLEKEILPNGKILKYHYKGCQLTCVESLDPKERFVYASIRIKGSPVNGNVHFLSSSGQTADYEYERRQIDVNIEVTEKGTSGRKCHVLCPSILSKVSSPNFRKESLNYCGRFLLKSYEGKDQHFQIVNRGYGGCYRVHKLSLPVGENNAFTPVYEFSYRPPVAGRRAGKTTVKASDGTFTIYHFSKNLLTSKIQYFGVDGQLKKEKCFFWDSKHWLKSVELLDGQKNLFYRKSYEYDQFGNPILETFTGDLTGSGKLETTHTKRIFSSDGKNLLLREKTEDGKVTCISYLTGTNLITSKLIKDGKKIILREFFIYDDCHNLVEKLSDDGSGENKDDLTSVTQRRSTTYILRQAAPFLHMPEQVIETHLESGVEKLLKKSHLIYDAHGNVAQEEVYDAEENLAYTIEKTYNERGDLLSETNRLGQKATHTYDSKGHLTASTNFSNRIHKTLSYDTRGRLCRVDEKGDDGTCHTISSRYDFHDRLIKKKDPFGNCTHYKHDPLVNEISQTDFPKVAAVDEGSVKVATFATYDPFGRKLTQTDPNGNTTTYSYNVYGSPTEIIYPDGGEETFCYAKNGDLVRHTDPDGLTICYTNDILGRVIEKAYVSQGKTLAEEAFTYSGFRLLSEVNKENDLKHYFYDGTGRKIREEFCGHVTEFDYDPLGRRSTICQYSRGDALITHYKRDLEDRVVEEKKTNLSDRTLHKINYSYDADGNRESIVRHINGKEATQTFSYDAFNRQLLQRDAERNETQTIYDENHTNALGQKVLQITTIDPKGIATVETQDALTRSVKVETFNPSGATISCYDMTYDPQGNLTSRRDHIYENAHLKTTQTVRYSYTPDHQIENLTRGYGTKDIRQTAYTYLPSGKLKTKTLPDGTTLSYSYHPLGYLSRLNSSDGTIHHTFTHNRLGYLLTAVDEVQNIAIQRQVDPFGNVIAETLPHGFEVQKSYDHFDRLTSLKMADSGKVLYDYDPLFLRKVTRVSKEGKALYSHIYEEYDLDGNLLSENLIGTLGRIEHLTTPRGQKAHISSPYFSQSCRYDSVGNLIANTIDSTENRYSYDDTYQLIEESGPNRSTTYVHDSLYNRVQKNGNAHKVNDLNELLFGEGTDCSYDLNGNQILKKTQSETSHFSYDPLNRLVEVASEKQRVYFTYDPLGRRLSKTRSNATFFGWQERPCEYYLYDDQNEIGAFIAPNKPKNLRVFGLSRHKNNPKTIGIEINGQAFAPIVDVQGNIRHLINTNKKIAASYDFSAFGKPLQTSPRNGLRNPWQFASKRLDPELGLIYFGKRYYDPELGRWITTDPAGFTDSTNPYQYVLNNPFMYHDPDGESVLGFCVGLVQIAAGGALIISGAAIEIATLGGYTIGFGFQAQAGVALIASGLATTTYHAQDIEFPRGLEKRHTPDQEAMSEFVKEFGKKGVSNVDADTLLEWAKEYDFPNRDDRGKPHWEGGEHIHLGPKHIPVNRLIEV